MLFVNVDRNLMRYFLTSLLVLFTMTANAATATKTAVFAGGCFWCMQASFDKLPGVSTQVGYTGGSARTADYMSVSSGATGHAEAIQIRYDPKKVPYRKLLDLYWENIDPTDEGGQFADRGSQYRPAIYYADATQQAAAEASRKAIKQKFAPQPIRVQVLAATPFYPAEEHHQKYYQKNNMRFKAYELGSGRAGFLQKLWGSAPE